MEKFKKLGISEPILKIIKELGFENPTEIQEKAIPYVLNQRDVIAGAATGSGKTFAFATGIIENTENQQIPQSLVLVPTRELAEQVADSLKLFSKQKNLRIAKIYGGVSMSPQIQSLKKADIIVATPGRLLDHLRRSTVDLSFIKTLVLDEADRMLDMGFIKDVDLIVNKCPKKRQTLMFSATISNEIFRLSKKYLINPIEVSARSQVDPSHLTQIYYDVMDDMKFSLLVHLLKQNKSDLSMVFCNTQRNTDFVEKNLKHQGINVLAIHGGHSQNKRKLTMDSFHAKHIDVLVCTDVAARGLDIKGVSHVYNYDVSKEAEQYIHRIGRTARAGKNGKAVTILSSRDYPLFNKLLQKQNLDIKKEPLPEFEKVFIKIREERLRNNFSNASRFRSQGRASRTSKSRFNEGSRPGFKRQHQSRDNPESESRSSRFNNHRGDQRHKPGNRRFNNKRKFKSRRF